MNKHTTSNSYYMAYAYVLLNTMKCFILPPNTRILYQKSEIRNGLIKMQQTCINQ